MVDGLETGLDVEDSVGPVRCGRGRTSQMFTLVFLDDIDGWVITYD
jgi:hypothetical protein